MEVESKTVQTQASAEKIYSFLSDFNNLSRMLPSDQGAQVQVHDADSCTINVNGFMQVTLSFLERRPYELLVLGPAGNSAQPLPFRMNVHIHDRGSAGSEVQVAFDVEGGNAMMNMMLKPKLRDAANKLVDQLQYFAGAL